MSAGDDPYRGDPYRGSAYHLTASGRCPRCSGPLVPNATAALACPRGCGVWLTRAKLRDKIRFEELDACEPDVGSLIGHPFPPAACALCGLTTAVRIQDGVAFDLCLDHGVWLDRGERARFEAAFDPHRSGMRYVRAQLEAEPARNREAADGPPAPLEIDLARHRDGREHATWLDGDAVPDRADEDEDEECAWLDAVRTARDGDRE